MSQRLVLTFLTTALAGLVAVATAEAASQTLLKAVEEKPLTLTLANGDVHNVRVLSLTETKAVVVDDEGNVLEFPLDRIDEVRVRPTDAQGHRPPEAAPSEAAPPSAQATDHAPAYESSQEENDAWGTPPADRPARPSRFYMRLGLSTSYARMNMSRGHTDSSWDGFMLGFDGAWGFRMSRSFAIHGSMGIRRFAGARESVDDGAGITGFHTPYRTVVSFAPGVTFTHRALFVSASMGVGVETRNALVGLSGEALLGVRFSFDDGGATGGIAFAYTAMSTMGERDRRPFVDDNPLVSFDTFSVGPRFFLEF